jgi:hypothetical protein
MHRDAENLMQQPVVDDHANEGPSSEERIYLPKGPFLNAHLNIGRQVVVKYFVLLSEKHV